MWGINYRINSRKELQWGIFWFQHFLHQVEKQFPMDSEWTSIFGLWANIKIIHRVTGGCNEEGPSCSDINEIHVYCLISFKWATSSLDQDIPLYHISVFANYTYTWSMYGSKLSIIKKTKIWRFSDKIISILKGMFLKSKLRYGDQNKPLRNQLENKR